MGLGGNLMWTPLAYEIYKKTGKITVFVKKGKIVEDKASLWKNLRFILDNSIHNLTYEQVYNNPNYKLIDMNIRPDLDKDGNPNIKYHTIISRCAHFNYFYPKLKIHMKFSNDEKTYIEKIRNKLPKKFIIIEPHAKTSWCEHKQYPLKKWQKIINTIYKDIPFVQMSMPDKKVMDNVINIANDIKNFRHAALMLKYASLFIATEGGFMHAASAHNTKCICFFTPMFDPIWTKYNNVDVIWVKENNHYNCFNQGTCKKCLEAMNNHNENIMINKIKKHFKI